MAFLNNVKWVSVSQVVKVGCQLSGMMIFSRYLTSHQFGLMSMTLVVCGFINIIRDMGFSSAIIQKESISEEFKNSVFCFNLLVGILLFIIVYFLAPVVSVFFNDSELTLVLRAIAIAFPINSITSINLSLLERESRFYQVAKCEAVASLLALFFAVIFAINNFGVFSLVIQTVLYSLLSGVGFVFYSKWKPKLSISFKDLHSTFSFSCNLVIFNFINYFSRNSDQVIIGKFFSVSILGQYSLAYRIMLFPLQNITYVLTRSLYPVLSRNISDKDSSLELYLKTIKVIVTIVAPLMLGMAAVSGDFVSVIFGGKWTLVPDIILWLAPTAILQSQVSTTGAVFMSQNKTKRLVLLTVFNAFLQILAFVIGGMFDVFVLIKLYFIANLIMYFPNMHQAAKCFNGGVLDILTKIYKPLLISVFMFIFVKYFNNVYLHVAFSSKVITLSISVASGFIFFSLLMVLFDRSFISDFKKNRGGNL